MLSGVEHEKIYNIGTRAIIRAASRENLYFGFPTRSYTNRAVQPQELARGLGRRGIDVAKKQRR